MDVWTSSECYRSAANAIWWWQILVERGAVTLANDGSCRRIFRVIYPCRRAHRRHLSPPFRTLPSPVWLARDGCKPDDKRSGLDSGKRISQPALRWATVFAVPNEELQGVRVVASFTERVAPCLPKQVSVKIRSETIRSYYETIRYLWTKQLRPSRIKSCPRVSDLGFRRHRFLASCWITIPQVLR